MWRLVQHLGVEVATGLRLRSSKQGDAVVVLFAPRPAALAQILPILQGQQVVAHAAWDKRTKCFYSRESVCDHTSAAFDDDFSSVLSTISNCVTIENI